ncbi:MAG: hypothetical protein JWP13_538 [Candidatus Saccharibacteria bacterium]|nr:hypothetical protein [Candidatus Saccharibacteria bacterium]
MFSGVVTASLSVLSGLVLLFAQVPSGTTYKLESYGVGSGGTANSVGSTYAMEGISGEVSGTELSGTAYKGGTGLITTQLANVPSAPALTNPANYYNKLRLTINDGGNASDARFAIAISKDNFATTQYVQNDNTVGAALGIEDYQTYATWGGTNGFIIVGLTPATTYTVKVRAMHGKFTESGYSATASAATVNPAITFDLDVSGSDVETSPPYNLAFNDLMPGAVTNSPSKIWVDFDTNGDFGGNIYVYGKNAGLRSAGVSYTIAALSGDLGALGQGFGVQSASTTQAAGGPFIASSPYDGINNTVGIADASIRKIYSAGAPITAGRSSMVLKAKVTNITPASNDYSEILTLIGAASF